MTRISEISAFLASTGLNITHRKTVAGDASNRRYERLSLQDGTTLILMDAPPEKGEDTRPFLRIADHLIATGLSAPKCVAKNIDRGFLLIEDFGDRLYDRLVANDPNAELEIYQTAWSALLDLSKSDIPTDIPAYDATSMANMAGLVAEWYDPSLDKGALITQMHKALNALDWGHKTLALRDFHAQNLIWLPERQGTARVGLLDFQDAQLGHILYDLISLVYDARRDVHTQVQTAILHQARKDTQIKDFDAAIATLLAQRSLRIIGVFARLWLRDGKETYLSLLPRVFGHLQLALQHPSLNMLSQILADIPPPNDTNIASLKARR